MRALYPTMRCLRSASRPKCIIPSQATRSFSICNRRLESTKPTEAEGKPEADPILIHRLAAERTAYYKRRSYYAGAGFILGMIAIWVTATSIDLPPKAAKLDSPDHRKDDPLVTLGREKKVVVQKLGEEVEENSDVVETGTSKVPTFPRVIDFVDKRDPEAPQGAGEEVGVEYQLVGLGVRAVSFLGIEVYVVGMYVATDDVAQLQEKLIRRIDNVATTLVAGEKEKLKALLLDPNQNEELWNKMLKESKARTIIRIVPVRNTDFVHLRDAWVSQLQARGKRGGEFQEFADESFGKSVADFKALFRTGKSIPKGKELLLSRNETGSFVAWYDDAKNGPVRLGEVPDERVSRALWLQYLGGKNVASEVARKSIVDGIMEFVERPVGTVATQVHL